LKRSFISRSAIKVTNAQAEEAVVCLGQSCAVYWL